MLPLPKGLRFATLDERKRFYEKEFGVNNLKKWLDGKLKNTVFTAIVGRHTNIYLEKYRKIKNNTIVIDNIRDLEHLRKYLLQYLPESAYYDRGVYENLEICRSCKIAYRKCWECKHFLGQELAFDLDPENIKCPYHGDYAKKMKLKKGLSFCMYEFNVVRKQALELYEELIKNYSKLKITYSGRGYHIHVLDEDAYKLTRK
ncbi:MAG: DNA primase [Candidatus Thermoplasmatota archaeon]